MLFGVELPNGMRRGGALLQVFFSLSLPRQTKSSSLVLKHISKIGSFLLHSIVS
jgi:hypothetical protein